MERLEHCESGSQRQGEMEAECGGLIPSLTQRATMMIMMMITSLHFSTLTLYSMIAKVGDKVYSEILTLCKTVRKFSLEIFTPGSWLCFSKLPHGGSRP